MVLSQEEIDGCREAFLAFDKDRSGTIDVWELRQVLEAMGQKPTEEELFQMISEVDENMSGSIDFAEFLKVIENQKERAENFDDESDMIDAFVACGGMQDKSGCVRRETLVRIIKHDFGLTIGTSIRTHPHPSHTPCFLHGSRALCCMHVHVCCSILRPILTLTPPHPHPHGHG